jgi:hypothetical protein
MARSLETGESEQGPQVFRNWLASSQPDATPLRISEYPLFSDSRVTSEEAATYMPYAFLNPIPLKEYPGFFRPAIYVRIEYFLPLRVPKIEKTDTSAFHGGTLIDEIGALLSLALGIRIKAGTPSREFDDKKDPRGRPVGWLGQPEFLNTKYDRVVVPSAISRPSLELLSPLLRLRTMTPDEANTLVKAARSYQKALLVAEEDPSLAWLFLVTAVEKAAGWWKSWSAPKLDTFRELKPELYLELSKLDEGDRACVMVAEDLFDLIRSKRKFVEFLLKFLPAPPAERPVVRAQVDWSESAMRKSLMKIYDHRSNALHEGTPFPPVMCDQPFKERSGDGRWYEEPGAHGYGTSGGTWTKEDVPMYLNTFAYIVRGALLKWWAALGQTSCSLEPSDPS